jgi:ribosomal protein L4
MSPAMQLRYSFAFSAAKFLMRDWNIKNSDKFISENIKIVDLLSKKNVIMTYKAAKLILIIKHEKSEHGFLLFHAVFYPTCI